MRRRFSQPALLLQERLAAFAKDSREQAALLPRGTLKDDLLSRARRADTAVHLDDSANSPGLKPAK